MINPVSFAGLLLASSADGPRLVDYLGTSSATGERVKLAERTVRRKNVANRCRPRYAGLGVRIYRKASPHGFWEPEAKSLMPGDLIVEIVPTAKREGALV